MDEVFGLTYTEHSDQLLTRVAAKLIAHAQGDVLVLSPDAMTPIHGTVRGWEDHEIYYRRHVDAAADGAFVNMDVANGTFVQGDALGDFVDDEADGGARPAWAVGWDMSYKLHSFKEPGDSVGMVKATTDGAYERFTPRYCMERSSNFARAVYPVVKHLYEQGLVGVDDTYDGR